MAGWLNNAAEFMSDPFGLGNSFTGGLSKSLGLDNNENIDSAQGTLDDIFAKASGVSAGNRANYADYLQQMKGLYGDGSSKFADAVASVADAIANYKDFDYDKNVNEFMDPSREQRVAAAMGAINNASAAGGNRFSSNYLDKLAAKQQALASEEWREAYDRMMQDRNQKLAEWQNGQKKVDNLMGLAGLYGNDRRAFSDALGDYYSNMANQNNADLQTYADVAGQKASLDTQRNSGVGSLVKVIGSIFG